MIGHTELILIVLVVFLLFGAKRIPELAKAKKAKDGLLNESEEMMNAAEKKTEQTGTTEKNNGTKAEQD